MKKRMLSILLAIMMIMPLFTINIGGVEASESMTATVNPTAESTKTGIDYSAADIILTGSINDEKTSGYSINLSKETFTVPANYKIAAYSTNGGTSWTAVTAARQFDNERLADSLSSNVTLAFTDKYETSRRRVPTDAVVVKFPKINKRPSLSSKDYTVNYELGADNTGKTTGTWLLTERNGKTSVKQGLEIGVLNSTGKLDEKGYGRFYGADGSTNGIEIAALPTDGKAVNTSYNIRRAAVVGSDGTYTAASKSVKITVDGQRAVPTYTVDKAKKTIAYPANTYIFKDKKTELKKTGGTVDIANYNGDVYLWSAPTSRAPTISAMQKVSVATAADGTLSYTTDTVTVLTEAALNAPAGVYTSSTTNNAPINAASGNMGITPMAASTDSMKVGDKKDLTVILNSPPAAYDTITAWSSSDPAVMKVSNAVTTNVLTNNVEALSAGSAIITATTTVTNKADSSQSTQTDTWTITVTQPVTGVRVESIEPSGFLEGSSPYGIPKGSKVTLKANLSPANATNQKVTWSSSNTTVATVNATTGVVTGIANGDARITVTTEDGSLTDFIEVKVVNSLKILNALITPNLAPPVVGTYYETLFQNLDAEGGTKYNLDDLTNNIIDGYKWSINGAIPNGLVFSKISGVWGIRGIPITDGNYSFTIRATDTQGFNVDTIEYKMSSGEPQKYTVVINKRGDNVQGDEVGQVGIRRGSIEHDGSPVTGGTVITFWATEGVGYYIDKWEVLVASPPGSNNYVPITGVDVGGLINELSHPVTANMIVNVWYKKYNIARYAVYGGVGGTMIASSVVPTKPTGNTPTNGFIYVKDNGDINFAATPAPGWDLYEWRYSSTAAPGRPAREPQDVVRSDGKTWAETGLTTPTEKYMLSTFNRIAVETEIVVNVEFVPRLVINTVSAPPRGKVDEAYTHSFTATIGSELVETAKIAQWEIFNIDPSSPTGSNLNAFPFQFVDAKSGVLTNKPIPNGLTKGKGGLYTFYVRVTLNDENGTTATQIFTIYVEDKFDVDYEIKTTAAGVNGKLYLKVGDALEVQYNGTPGQNNSISSHSNILEGTSVTFRAEPSDMSLYWAVWKIIDKNHADYALYGTNVAAYPANSEAVLVDTGKNVINYGGFSDENRNIYTIPINKNIYVTVTFESKPALRLQFTAMDITTEDPAIDASGGAVTAMAHDREPPRDLFAGISVTSTVNTVRANSKVVFTAYPNAEWVVHEWRLYNVTVANSDGTGAITSVSTVYNAIGSGSTCELTIVDHVRVVAVFTPKSTTPVTSITVNPTEISIGESGNGAITSSVLPQAADQRVKWSIGYKGTSDELKNKLAAKLEITDPNNLQLNEVKNQAGDIIAYSYRTRSSSTDSWSASQEIISIEPDSSQGVKIIVGKPTKYGNYKDLVFEVTATSAVNKERYKSSTVTITEYIPATGVSLQPETLTMVVRNETALTATVLPSSPPEPLGASNKNVTWGSSNSNIVFVDSNGKVTALEKGTATITVTTVDGNFTDTCVITVIEAFVELDKPNNYTFTTNILGYTDAGTHTVRITNKAKEAAKVTVKLEGPHKDNFEVSPALFENMPANSFNMLTVKPKANLPVGVYTAIVVVEGTSVATGKSVGTLKFEVSFKVVKDATEIPPSQSIKITVLSSPREPVSQNGRTTYILYVGETLNVRADKNYPENPDAQINWKTDPVGIVEFRNSAGETNVITAKTIGNATIEASYGPTDIIYITVAGRPQIILPDEVTNLAQYDVQVPGGSLSQAHLPNSVIGTPYNQTLLTTGFVGYYSSTVNSTPTGSPPLYWRVIGGSLPPGLTLTQWIDGTTAPIGANHQAGSVIEGTPTAAGSGKLYTFTLEAGEIVYYAQGSNVIWRAPDGGSSGFSIACVNDNTLCNHPTVIINPITGAKTVNNACTRFERVTLSNGRVVLFAPQMKAVRTMNIYVRTESYFAATGLKITADKMTTGTVSGVSQKLLSMPAGTTSTVTPIISPANATVKNVVYESSNTNVAAIDSSGKINAKEAGTALISVTTIDGNLSDTILVTVTKVNVTGISLNTQKITVGLGGTATFTVTIRPSNASVKDVTWTTSDASIVSVDKTGKITGIKPTAAGSTVSITATSVDNPSVTAIVQVTVSPLAVTGVTLKTETTLGIRDTETLLATVIPVNASDKNVTWSSSDTAVATVNNEGLITGVAAGTATITVKTADGSYTSTCKITVLNSYNIKLEQSEGGTVTMSATKALSGAKVNLSASPNPGYYLVGWETSPIDVAIAAGSFTMPAQNITVIPIFKKFTFMNEYIPPLNLDTTKPSYSFKFATNIAHNSLGISIRASELAELARRNPNFTIDIETTYGIYQFPVNIMSIIPDINGILSRNNVNVNEIVFNIIITDKKKDKAVLDAVEYYMPPVSNIIGSAVDFTVEIARIDASGNPGNRIAVVDNLTQKVTRLIPLNPNAAPTGQQWGAYKYNPQTNQFEFVPHVTRNIEGNWYTAIMSNTNGIHVVSKNPIGFADVAVNQWYTPYIAKAASKRLVQGMGGGLYQPDTNITRAQFVQMIVNAVQLPSGTSTPYSDVKESDWFYSAITRARSAGLLNKFTGSTFKPNQPITRGEMTVILAAALRRYGFAPNDESIRRFQADFIDSVSPDNLGDAALVYSLGIMNGTGNGYYSPGGYTTRAQAATVQIRLLEILGFIDR